MRVQYPRCIIRIDIAHLIKLVARWNCDHESPYKKDFYLRCVGLLSTCTEINEFVQICTDILSIAFASHEDIYDKESHCVAAHNRVVNHLKMYNLPNDVLRNPKDNDPELLERFDNFNNEVILQSSNAIDTIMEKIKTGSIDNLKESRLNPYHCSDFGSRLFKLSKHFVL